MNLPKNSAQSKKKIIWAMDTMQTPEDVWSIVEELKIWSEQLKCLVQPVSVFSKYVLNFPMEFAYPWTQNFEKMAKASVENYMNKINANNFLKPELLFAPTISNRKMATEITKYAEKHKAQLIFASTCSSRINKQRRVGTFAETLVATSKIPVLLLNPAVRASSEISSILFPTDFSKESKNAVSRIESFAKAFKANVILYNQVETTNIYPLEFISTWQTQAINMESILKDVEKVRTRKGSEWSHSLERSGVKSCFLIQRQKKNLGTDILEAANKNKVSIIALSSHSGALVQAIFGGVARDILLQAECPVLVFHRPKALAKKTKLSEVSNKAYLNQLKSNSPKNPLKEERI